jgi:hypothetical protein
MAMNSYALPAIPLNPPETAIIKIDPPKTIRLPNRSERGPPKTEKNSAARETIPMVVPI